MITTREKVAFDTEKHPRSQTHNPQSCWNRGST